MQIVNGVMGDYDENGVFVPVDPDAAPPKKATSSRKKGTKKAAKK